MIRPSVRVASSVVPQPLARRASAAVFFAVGTVFGSWASRIPAVKHELSLSDAALSVALLSLEGGAVLGLPRPEPSLGCPRWPTSARSPRRR